MVTDILNREIHVGDTVLRARTRKGTRSSLEYS